MNEEEQKETAVTETETAGVQTPTEESAAVAETPKNGLIAKFKAWWKRFSEKHPKGSKLIWQFIKFFRVLQRSDDISISSVYVSAVCVRVGNGENRMDLAGDRVAVGSEMDDHRICARV